MRTGTNPTSFTDAISCMRRIASAVSGSQATLYDEINYLRTILREAAELRSLCSASLSIYDQKNNKVDEASKRIEHYQQVASILSFDNMALDFLK